MAKVQIIPRRSFFLGDVLLNESEVATVEEADVDHLIKSGWVVLVEAGDTGAEQKPATRKKASADKAESGEPENV